MSERALKTAWHLLLVGAAAFEFKTSKTSFRRLLVGAAAGWHLAAAYDDWFGEDEKQDVTLALDSFDVGYALGQYEAENPPTCEDYEPVMIREEDMDDTLKEAIKRGVIKAEKVHEA